MNKEAKAVAVGEMFSVVELAMSSFEESVQAFGALVLRRVIQIIREDTKLKMASEEEMARYLKEWEDASGEDNDEFMKKLKPFLS